MEASALGQDLLPRQLADHQFAAVSNHGGLGKAGYLSVGDPDRSPDLIGHAAQAGAEHNRHLGLPHSNLLPYRFRGCFDVVHRITLRVVATGAGSRLQLRSLTQLTAISRRWSPTENSPASPRALPVSLIGRGHACAPVPVHRCHPAEYPPS